MQGTSLPGENRPQEPLDADAPAAGLPPAAVIERGTEARRQAPARHRPNKD